MVKLAMNTGTEKEYISIITEIGILEIEKMINFMEMVFIYSQMERDTKVNYSKG